MIKLSDSPPARCLQGHSCGLAVPSRATNVFVRPQQEGIAGGPLGHCTRVQSGTHFEQMLGGLNGVHLLGPRGCDLKAGQAGLSRRVPNSEVRRDSSLPTKDHQAWVGHKMITHNAPHRLTCRTKAALDQEYQDNT